MHQNSSTSSVTLVVFSIPVMGNVGDDNPCYLVSRPSNEILVILCLSVCDLMTGVTAMSSSPAHLCDLGSASSNTSEDGSGMSGRFQMGRYMCDRADAAGESGKPDPPTGESREVLQAFDPLGYAEGETNEDRDSGYVQDCNTG